ncbi:MAG: hypothetical protein ACRYG4_04035 [Janthinobacterium lividum]
MAKFAATMQKSALQKDNHPSRAHAKVALRRDLLAAIGADEARVFDAFAGSGGMHRAVWREAADYTGCDLRRFTAGRRAFVADNLRVLRAVDLAAFNLFDLDAYGSPWKAATIIAARRSLAPGELLGLVLTDGSPMRARLGAIDAGLSGMAAVDPKLTGMSLRWRELTGRALEEMARRMGGEVVEFHAADTGSRPILYSTALIVGLTGGRSDSAA